MQEIATPPTEIWALERQEHLVLWSFRVVGGGRARCPTLRATFVHLFGEAADEALGALYALVMVIGRTGRRRLTIHPPGCVGCTADEQVLTAMIAAAQDGDDARLDAHLAWVLGRPADTVVRCAVHALAQILSRHRLTLPVRTLPCGGPDAPRQRLRVVH